MKCPLKCGSEVKIPGVLLTVTNDSNSSTDSNWTSGPWVYRFDNLPVGWKITKVGLDLANTRRQK